MKKLLFIFCLLASLPALAQTTYVAGSTTVNTMVVRNDFRIDSAFLLPGDTLKSAPNFSMARKGASIYIKGATGVWALISGASISSTDALPEGSTNLYWTPARFDTRFGTKTTDNLTQGSTNKYFSNALARLAISVTGTGGSYDNTTGVLTLTGGSSSTLSQPQKDTVNKLLDSAFNAPANSFTLRNSKAPGDTIFRGTSNPNQGLFKTINVTSADGTITIVKTKTDSSWAADISTAGVHDSGTPTVVANSGAGTGATVSITGTDRRGTITVTAGTSPTAGQSICSLTFNTAYSSTPFVIIQASFTVGGSVNPIPRVSATPTTSTFSFISDPTAGLVASTVYKFTYIVVQ